MEQRTFDIYSDPGHGWMKVPKAMLVQLGIASKITKYSYMRGDHAFLEEDQDLTTFVKAAEAHGITVKYREHIANKQSRIRNYEPYKLTTIESTIPAAIAALI